MCSLTQGKSQSPPSDHKGPQKNSKGARGDRKAPVPKILLRARIIKPVTSNDDDANEIPPMGNMEKDGRGVWKPKDNERGRQLRRPTGQCRGIRSPWMASTILRGASRLKT